MLEKTCIAYSLLSEFINVSIAEQVISVLTIGFS